MPIPQSTMSRCARLRPRLRPAEATRVAVSRRPSVRQTRMKPSRVAAFPRAMAQVMTKGADDAGFVGKEMARLTKMMDDGSVKPAKKEQFGRRLNMLSSFS
eukprot:5912894-Prymnesium_polylepis.2